MKIAHIFAAALMVAGIGVSAEASAQRHDRDDRGGRHYDRRDDHRNNDRWGRHDNGRHNGWNNRRNNCRVVYRNHRRVRVCR